MAIIGIDLGTSNPAAAVLHGGRDVIIPGADGIDICGRRHS
jgi:molecular chaperone DnaK